ncbi:hypothetical protein VB774_13630 [Pseudanabaena galeata UHCC 0370]|uniref:Isopropylmalate/homocitrate/citramalate synthases n=1 Tax=Pseudanabaena galeata UHCC 0370 TaxID=3110310 RepID=A0ABU5TM78_9CYAN|nr:hypothetical protein [Pseudanabaena galeata]MEA5478663.1 hypothetical protein [Pseudanabaena galeata UHCC 0370]
MSTNTQCMFPQSRYYGKFTPENLVFNANLQEFSHRVSIICSLETGGKISSQEAYSQVAGLWQQLEKSKQNLFT